MGCGASASPPSAEVPMPPPPCNAVAVPTCARPGCARPTWDGRPGGYCSKTCKDGGPAGEPGTLAVCPRPGCGKPAWNGEPGKYCGKSCRLSAVSPGTQVSQAKFEDIQRQFTSKWDTKRGACPTIKSIWHVHDPKLLERHEKYCQGIGNVRCFGSGQNPGNVQRRFHCTTMKCVGSFSGTPCNASDCASCSIIKSGFLLKFAGKCGSAWGAGIYSSPTPSYANWVASRKCTFLCSVACGSVDKTDSKGPLPSGTHSRVASSTTGNPSDNELIVFDEAAIIPMYLILF